MGTSQQTNNEYKESLDNKENIHNDDNILGSAQDIDNSVNT